MLRFYCTLVRDAWKPGFAKWRELAAFVTFTVGGVAYYGYAVNPIVPWTWFAIAMGLLVGYALLRENYQRFVVIERERDALVDSVNQEARLIEARMQVRELRSAGHTLLNRVSMAPIQLWKADGSRHRETVRTWASELDAVALRLWPMQAALLHPAWVEDYDGRKIRNVAPDSIPSRKSDVELYLTQILRQLDQLLSAG